MEPAGRTVEQDVHCARRVPTCGGSVGLAPVDGLGAVGPFCGGSVAGDLSARNTPSLYVQLIYGGVSSATSQSPLTFLTGSLDNHVE